MRTVRISDLEPIPVVDGRLEWRPIRRTLGIEAFGINAYTANTGGLVIEEHDETPDLDSNRDDPRFPK